MAKRWGVVLAAVLLAGCAGQDADLEYLRERDTWNSHDSYAPEIRRVVQANGYCVNLDIRGEDFVFSRAAQARRGDEMATLASAGLFQPIATTPELENAQHGEPGTWYRITDLGRTYHSGGASWCFGQRADITVTDQGTPKRNKHGTILRTITYRYRAEGLPDFTQTEAFRKVFPKAPANGAVLTDTIKLVFGWKAIWALPMQPMEV